MSIISADISKMKSDSETLKQLANKYNKTILSFESTIRDMSCWSGEDANNYKKDLLGNIEIYEQVGNILLEYANFLGKEADKIKKLAKENTLSWVK